MRFPWTVSTSRVLAVAAGSIAACVLVLAASAAPAPQFAYRAVSPGYHSTCAITAGGAARCWGITITGELGNRPPTRNVGTRVPVTVLGLGSGVTAVTGGSGFSCGIARGAAWCWGTGTNHGELGNGRKEKSIRPVAVTGLGSGVKAIDAGLTHACALTSAGGVRCWGGSILGDGKINNRESATPVDVVGLTSGVKAIAVGYSISCAITSAGGVKCWGGGTLGNGTNRSTGGLLPVDVSGLGSGVRAISAGENHACALTSAGGLKCWGAAGSGQLGRGGSAVADALTPVDVVGLTSGVAAVAAGQAHTCALTSVGTVKCWGLNNSGQLGLGRRTVNMTTPVDVVGLGSGVRAVASSGDLSCAIDRAGITKCWGSNANEKAGLALPFRVNYAATPMAVYGQGAAVKSTSLASFRSPTGNISCRVSAASVRCQSRQRPHSVTMNGSGRLTICRGARCLGNPAAGAATLGYGGRTTVGRFTCRSAFSGITCTVTSSGRGFVINKDGVRRVG